jgi:argininosuccinate lyase
MPHKKNPDVLELMRAKYHSVVACEFEIKNCSANLMSGYNRDIQLTKYPTMRAIEITQQSLIISKHIFCNLKVDKDRCESAMTDELFATDRVYKMVKKGIPFREAYKIVSKDLL